MDREREKHPTSLSDSQQEENTQLVKNCVRVCVLRLRVSGWCLCAHIYVCVSVCSVMLLIMPYESKHSQTVILIVSKQHVHIHAYTHTHTQTHSWRQWLTWLLSSPLQHKLSQLYNWVWNMYPSCTHSPSLLCSPSPLSSALFSALSFLSPSCIQTECPRPKVSDLIKLDKEDRGIGVCVCLCVCVWNTNDTSAVHNKSK